MTAAEAKELALYSSPRITPEKQLEEPTTSSKLPSWLSQTDSYELIAKVAKMVTSAQQATMEKRENQISW